MAFFVDTHCHLLAVLDDGPRTSEEAATMCELAWDEGIRVIAATGHLDELWPDVTPEAIRRAVRRLAEQLQERGMPLSIRPNAEVMLRPGLEKLWDAGALLGRGGRREFLLLEMPSTAFCDLAELVEQFRQRGVRLVLAHPERHPEWLHDRPAIERLVNLGCLVQVSSDSIAEPLVPADARALRHWLRDGIVHLVGSDAHSPGKRAPRMRAAYRRIADWAPPRTADRLCSLNGLMILEGMPFPLVPPKPYKRRWFSRFLRAE